MKKNQPQRYLNLSLFVFTLFSNVFELTFFAKKKKFFFCCWLVDLVWEATTTLQQRNIVTNRQMHGLVFVSLYLLYVCVCDRKMCHVSFSVLHMHYIGLLLFLSFHPLKKNLSLAPSISLSLSIPHSPSSILIQLGSICSSYSVYSRLFFFHHVYTQKKKIQYIHH